MLGIEVLVLSVPDTFALSIYILPAKAKRINKAEGDHEPDNEPPKSWCIYIDIEGFAANNCHERGRIIARLASLMV
jgi:hypothetical protein